MALVKENGSGVSSANSYANVADVTAYLTNRNRQTENGWDAATTAVKEAACIAATDYIENKFGRAFRGVKQYSDVSLARSTVEFTAQPTDGEIVTIGAQVYTFRGAIAVADDVLIGANLSASIDNLVGAITADANLAGTGFGTGTVANADASAQGFYDDAMLAFALDTGTAGNAVATTTDVTGATWNFATLTGGSDRSRPQPLAFPRSGLVDRDGVLVIGMPDDLLAAASEYAVRSSSSTLAPDPTADALGGSVTSIKEKVGPIETATTYLPGSAGSGALPAYPAADRLLSQYTRSSGGAIR